MTIEYSVDNFVGDSLIIPLKKTPKDEQDVLFFILSQLKIGCPSPDKLPIINLEESNALTKIVFP